MKNTCRVPAQRHLGIVLFTVLIALVVISLSAVALIRSVDTGTMISGNLAFRQATMQAGDGGTETAVAWLAAQLGGDPKSLYTSQPGNGYYATWMSGCDVSGGGTLGDSSDDPDWNASGTENDKCNMTARAVPGAMMPEGYSAAFVINRLCDQEGNPAAVTCETYSRISAAADAGKSMAGGNYSPPLSGRSEYFYRVTTRVMGPRNTVSYVQTVLLN
jgi:Tfp pilus assembly protein PilX